VGRVGENKDGPDQSRSLYLRYTRKLQKRFREWKKLGVITSDATQFTSTQAGSSSVPATPAGGQLPLRRYFLQPLPHPTQLRRGVVVLRVLLRSPPLANLHGVTSGCGPGVGYTVVVFGAPRAEAARLRVPPPPQATGTTALPRPLQTMVRSRPPCSVIASTFDTITHSSHFFVDHLPSIGSD
jgi:hypothetical protein